MFGRDRYPIARHDSFRLSLADNVGFRAFVSEFQSLDVNALV